MPLTPSQRATLDAAARRIVPHAYDGGPEQSGLTARVEEKVGAMAPELGADFALALSILGSAASVFLTLGQARSFAKLSSGAQDAMLERWGHSRLPPLRTVFQAVRRLVLAVWYSLPDSQREIGYLGPLHTRQPSVPWEGPAPGVTRDVEPIARGNWPATPQSPVPSPQSPFPIPRSSSLTADVVVIGTGAGGAVAAARLAEAGKDVVMLEEGGYHTAADFDEREAEMAELLYADRGMRATEDLSTQILQGRTVGGGTTVNWLIMLRTPDHVLEEWARDAGTTGMSPAGMRPVFERIEREVHAAVVPDDAHSPNNRLILDAARALEWKAEAGVINAKGCVRSGFCGQGCRYDARQGALAVFIPRAIAAGARLYPDTRAEKVEVIERGGARALKRVTATVRGRATVGGVPPATLVIDAPTVILAGGAVETPALLQRSGFGGGGVGRFLRLHPTTAVIGLYDREIYAAAGIPLSAVCTEFLRRDANGYGFWIECPPLHPSLGAVALPGFGAAHRADMAGYRRIGTIMSLVRDGADRALSNGSVVTTRGGRTRIRYRLGPTDSRHMVEAMQASARLQLAAGAREAWTLHTRPVRIRTEHDIAEIAARPHGPNQFAMFSAHVNGTCRIGTDPRTSGCTPDGQRHGVPGLYVCDGSLLPTAPGVNPQETIMAMATVLAERI